METTAAIVAMGAVTSVGLSAAETASSVRAGVCRFAETPYRGRYSEPLVMGALPEEMLPPPDPLLSSFPGVSVRQTRMLRLAGLALAEVRESLSRNQAVPLFLALPEEATEGEAKDNRDLLNLLSVQAEVKLNLAASKLFPTGRAGGIVALKEAADLLSAGKHEYVLLGGADTYWDRWLLQRLDREGRVNSRFNNDGFIPGEGAAFLLLSSWKAVRNAKATVLGSIEGVGTGFEVGHRLSQEAYRGDGLANAFGDLFDSCASRNPIGAVYAGFNGESYPAKSWGVGFLRHSGRFKADHRFEHPADCMGDTGAAMAPIMVILAVVGMRAGHSEGPCLVWCLSDRGDCGALLANIAAPTQDLGR
jgi:3-oxoacyl-[acyl-carrier-protein] synthase I